MYITVRWLLILLNLVNWVIYNTYSFIHVDLSVIFISILINQTNIYTVRHIIRLKYKERAMTNTFKTINFTNIHFYWWKRSSILILKQLPLLHLINLIREVVAQLQVLGKPFSSDFQSHFWKVRVVILARSKMTSPRDTCFSAKYCSSLSLRTQFIK